MQFTRAMGPHLIGDSSTTTVSVTILIVNWNSGELLSECLCHLALQTVQPEHVLIVDNGSTDGSADFVETAKNITVHRMNANLGFAGGNNWALAKCRSEFVALLNPDAFPEPDWLERLLDSANSHPSVAAFGSCQLVYGDPNILDGIGDVYHMSGMVWRDRYRALLRADDSISREIFSPCAAAALYRSRAVMDVGGFDDDYFCYVEDIDLGFRLRLAGHTALYVPEAIVRHVGSATTGGRHSNFYVYYGHRNLVWTYIKNMPGLLFWSLLPLHLVINVATLMLYTFKGQGIVISRAKWDAIKGIPKMWRKRRNIQSQRIASVASIWQVLDKRLWPSRESALK